MSKLKIYSALILSMILWAFSFIWSKEALNTYTPFTIITYRLIVSAALLWIYAIISKKLDKINLKDIKYFFMLASLEPFLYFLGETFGLQHVSSTIAAVMISTIPIFVPIFAYFLFKDKLSFLNILGAILSLLGVLIIIINPEFKLDVSLKGILLLSLSVFAAVGYSLVVKSLSTRYRPTTIVTYQSTIALIGFIPLFFIFDFNNTIKIGFDKNAIIAIIELGIFASTIAFILFTFGIKKIGVSKASFFTNSIPVFTAILAYFILGETLSMIKYIGIIIVILGLILSQLKIKKT